MFGPDYTIRRYSDIYEVISDFYDVRLELYKKRKVHLLKSLEGNIKLLKNKILFITSVISNKISLQHPRGGARDREDIIKDLQKLSIKPIHDDEEKSDGYNYLFHMNFMSFTQSKLKGMEDDLSSFKEEYDAVKKTSEKDMWLKEINSLKKYLEKSFEY